MNRNPCSGCGSVFRPIDHRIRFCSRSCAMRARAVRPLEERFWEKVDKRGTDECWPWTAGTNDGGYGRIRQGGEGSPDLIAHRCSWELANGRPIPAGMVICHRCDNPPCVNPAHLFLGTRRDNVRDMIAKGRAPDLSRTHCKRGHEFTPQNSYPLKEGGRRCRECVLAYRRAVYHQRRAA